MRKRPKHEKRADFEEETMPRFKVGIIGCGHPWKTAGATGFRMGHLHAAGYEASPDAEIVAAADVNCPRPRLA